MTQPQSPEILNRIFSSELFRNADTAALVKQFDTTDGIRAAAVSNPFVVPYQPQTAPAISSIPAGGIAITQPGTYYFTQDIDWIATQASAILIHADNVVLDMKGYQLNINLENTGSFNTQKISGIIVNGQSQVTVQNGTISSPGYHGISATGTSGLQLQDITVTGLNYKSITENTATPAGIFIDTSIGFTVQDCTVTDTHVFAASCAGIQVLESAGGTVTGCSMSDFTNADGAVQGYSYVLSTIIKTSNCTSSNFSIELCRTG